MFDCKASIGAVHSTDVAPTLRQTGGQLADTVNALKAQAGRTGKGDAAPCVTGVRRLMPIECERLMGLPDDHTRYGMTETHEYEIADSHRYSMCGNAVVVNVIEQIAGRLRRQLIG